MLIFGKKKEEKKEAGCCCECSAAAEETAALSGCCGEKAEDGFCVKVLGSGCKSCHALYENALQAVKAAKPGAEVEYITDLQKVMEYGVMSMPALVINGRVVSMGKVLKAADIAELLKMH